MVKIRLRRMGGKKNPFYRIVVADSRSPRDGRCIEEIGTYDPLKDPAEVTVVKDRADYWLAKGAQPTDTVRALLKKASIDVAAKKISKTPPKAAPKAEQKEETPKAAAPKAEAPKEEAPKAETPAEAAPAEEAPAETPAEEAPAEPPAEEAPAEAPSEEASNE